MRFVMHRLLEPEAEPITLEEAKRHLNIVDDDIGSPTVPGPNDEDILALISVAREMVEDYTGRALVDQTWRIMVGDSVSFDLVSGDYLRSCRDGLVGGNWRTAGLFLHRSPVLELVAVSQVDDATGTETELFADGSPEVPPFYLIDRQTKWPRAMPGSSVSWSGRLQIDFRAGYVDLTGSPQDEMTKIPATLKHAIKLIVGHFFENREIINIGNLVSELPFGIKNLLNPHRCHVGFA